MTDNNDIVIAVWMVTYNHERYIAEAIEGVMMQETKYRYKLYIGEDCSKDSTRAICQQYAERYPDKIELICTAQNSIMQNSLNIWYACINSGARYIATCEGDDYWTDKHKLQKQVEFLEQHPDYSICFSRVEVLDQMGMNLEYSRFFPKLDRETYTIEDFLSSSMNMIPTPTVVFRNVLPCPLPEFYLKGISGDLAIQFIVADTGKAKYIDEATAVYRNHSGGVTKSKENIEKGVAALIKLLEGVDEHFKHKYSATIRKRLLGIAKWRWISNAGDKKGTARIKHYFRHMPDYFKYSDKIQIKEVVYYHLLFFFPRILKLKSKS